MKKILSLARQQSRQAEAADLLATILRQPWYFIGIRYAARRALVLNVAGRRKVGLAETVDLPVKLALVSIISKYQKIITGIATLSLRSAARMKTSNTSSSSAAISAQGPAGWPFYFILEINALLALR